MSITCMIMVALGIVEMVLLEQVLFHLPWPSRNAMELHQILEHKLHAAELEIHDLGDHPKLLTMGDLHHRISRSGA